MAFAITVLLTSGFIGFSTFYATRSFIRDGIRQRLENITALAIANLDTQAHARIRNRTDESSEPYQRIKRSLQQIRAVSRDIRFVYTYRIDANGKITFVVDAEDANSPDVSHVGDDFPETSPLARTIYLR